MGGWLEMRRSRIRRSSLRLNRIYRHVLTKQNEIVCVCELHARSQHNLSLLLPECGETPDRLSLYELITPLAFLSPQPSSQVLPSGNTCVTELCSSVQGALLDNFLLTSPPPPHLSCPPAIRQLLLYLPLCAVDETETSLQKRERSSGYLPQDVFTEEQPSLRRRSV